MASPRVSLTSARLKALVHYDPETGIFTALVSRRGGIKKGQQLGWINGNVRRNMSIDGVTYLSARLAWLYQKGVWPPNIVDHWDRDTLNDRWNNLRLASNAENGRNTNLSKRNTSGHKGVMWYRRKKLWTASIRVNRKLLHLGYFPNKSAAIAARRAAELKHFGEFSPLAVDNQPITA